MLTGNSPPADSRPALRPLGWEMLRGSMSIPLRRALIALWGNITQVFFHDLVGREGYALTAAPATLLHWTEGSTYRQSRSRWAMLVGQARYDAGAATG